MHGGPAEQHPRRHWGTAATPQQEEAERAGRAMGGEAASQWLPLRFPAAPWSRQQQAQPDMYAGCRRAAARSCAVLLPAGAGSGRLSKRSFTSDCSVPPASAAPPAAPSAAASSGSRFTPLSNCCCWGCWSFSFGAVAAAPLAGDGWLRLAAAAAAASASSATCRWDGRTMLFEHEHNGQSSALWGAALQET